MRQNCVYFTSFEIWATIPFHEKEWILQFERKVNSYSVIVIRKILNSYSNINVHFISTAPHIQEPGNALFTASVKQIS